MANREGVDSKQLAHEFDGSDRKSDPTWNNPLQASLEDRENSPALKSTQANATSIDHDGNHVIFNSCLTKSYDSATNRLSRENVIGPKGVAGRETELSQQKVNESALRGSNQSTGNLIGEKFGFEGDSARIAAAKSMVGISNEKDGQGRNDLSLNIYSKISSDKDLILSTPINYQFKPVTPLQVEFNKTDPNIDLGHIVHVKFEAKSDHDTKIDVELMGAEAPYKRSGSQRIDVDPAHGAKNKNGYTSFDFYEVVPSTSKPGDLNFKVNLGKSQDKEKLDIKGISVSEVQTAPGLDPQEVIRQYHDEPHTRADQTPFIFGAIGNKLINSNIRMTESQLNEKVEELTKGKSLSDTEKQTVIAALHKAVTDFSSDNAPSADQKSQYLRALKELGVNTLTVPVYWEQIQGSSGAADYSRADEVVELAKQNGMKVKLHPVVWADLYPKWVDQGYDAAKQKDPSLSKTQYTENVIKKHISDVINHFGEKYGSEIGYVEINEMNSTEQLNHPKLDDYGRVIRDNNEAETESVQNGLTDWIKRDSAATVVNKIDGWIRESLSKNPELKNTQVLENEYLSDQDTRAFSKLVSDDSSKPDGFGLEAHQFNSDHPTLNENDPLLSIANQINNRQVGGVKSYVSELTVETTGASKNFDEAKLSPDVQRAVDHDADYRNDNNLPPLSSEDRKAQEQQAEELLAWFKMSTANDRNMGISLWDGSDKNAWLGNTGGVMDSDYNRKISYFAVQEFIQEFKARNPQ